MPPAPLLLHSCCTFFAKCDKDWVVNGNVIKTYGGQTLHDCKYTCADDGHNLPKPCMFVQWGPPKKATNGPPYGDCVLMRDRGHGTSGKSGKKVGYTVCMNPLTFPHRPL